MNTVYLKKRIECRFGVSLFPNHPYKALYQPDQKKWNVQVTPLVFVSVPISKIKEVRYEN